MMELLMPALADSRLTTFNTLAARYQDDAFTLACYFLGEDDGAAEATQAAFANLYPRIPQQASAFRLEVLRRVLAICLQQSGHGRGNGRGRGGLFQQKITRPTRGEAIDSQLLDLKTDERAAVILIDVIGLDYDEAAQVLNCSKKQTGRLLAQARIHLSRQAVPALSIGGS